LILGGVYYLHEHGSLPSAIAKTAVAPRKPPTTIANVLPAQNTASSEVKTPGTHETPSSGKVINITPNPATVSYAVTASLPSKPAPVFADYITNPALDLTSAFISLLQTWNIKNITPTQSHCTAMAALGLQCLLQQGTWNQVVKLNRPVILELLLNNLTKRFVTVKAIMGDQLTLLHGDNETHYSLNEVLSYWRGSYALLWKPLEPHLTRLAQGSTSVHVSWVRDRLSIKDASLKNTARPNFFDSGLRQRLLEYQKANGITPTGVVGAQTFILLGNTTDDMTFPRLSSNK
jgi:general secretion pathway protein A